MNEKSIQISYITNFKEYVYLFVYILLTRHYFQIENNSVILLKWLDINQFIFK